MASDENNRNLDVCLSQLGVKFKPAQPRQAHVKNDTTRSRLELGSHEIVRRGKDFSSQPHRTEEPAKRRANPRVIVDDVYDRIGVCHEIAELIRHRTSSVVSIEQ